MPTYPIPVKPQLMVWAQLSCATAWEQVRSRVDEKGDFGLSELCCSLQFLTADFIEGEGDRVADLNK